MVLAFFDACFFHVLRCNIFLYVGSTSFYFGFHFHYVVPFCTLWFRLFGNFLRRFPVPHCGTMFPKTSSIVILSLPPIRNEYDREKGIPHPGPPMLLFSHADSVHEPWLSRLPCLMSFPVVVPDACCQLPTSTLLHVHGVPGVLGPLKD